MSADRLRFGVIGVGARGGEYARALAAGAVPGAVLGALCDRRAEALEPFAECARFRDARALVRSGAVDAVVVATPHREHVEPTLESLAAGLHVLTEKPLAVDPAGVARLLAAHADRAKRTQLFATAFVLRADARYAWLRKQLASGKLGRVQRVAWTLTDCLRPAQYYASAGWRGTFDGEGGGLLLNQCFHQLDLWQWLFGMPKRVHAFCGFGRFHAIEVEDEVTAYLEHDEMTGVLVASTGEAPGTNRLEVAAENGRVVIEGGVVETWSNAVPTSERVRTALPRASAPPASYESLSVAAGGLDPAGLLTNFVRAASGQAALLAPAAESTPAVELANALLWSGLGSRSVPLPLDVRACESALERLVGQRRRVG